MLEVRDLEARLRNDGHGLNIHVGSRQQEALLRDRSGGRDAPLQELPPDILIGRHRLDGRVILIGAHQIGALRAGGVQHSIEIGKNARRFLLALGQPRMRRAWRKDLRGNAVLEVLSHQSGCENPAARFHALRKPDLAGAELDWKQRLRHARRAFGCHCLSSRWRL